MLSEELKALEDFIVKPRPVLSDLDKATFPLGINAFMKSLKFVTFAERAMVCNYCWDEKPTQFDQIEFWCRAILELEAKAEAEQKKLTPKDSLICARAKFWLALALLEQGRQLKVKEEPALLITRGRYYDMALSMFSLSITQLNSLIKKLDYKVELEATVRKTLITELQNHTEQKNKSNQKLTQRINNAIMIGEQIINTNNKLDYKSVTTKMWNTGLPVIVGGVATPIIVGGITVAGGDEGNPSDGDKVIGTTIIVVGPVLGAAFVTAPVAAALLVASPFTLIADGVQAINAAIQKTHLPEEDSVWLKEKLKQKKENLRKQQEEAMRRDQQIKDEGIRSQKAFEDRLTMMRKPLQDQLTTIRKSIESKRCEIRTLEDNASNLKARYESFNWNLKNKLYFNKLNFNKLNQAYSDKLHYSSIMPEQKPLNSLGSLGSLGKEINVDLIKEVSELRRDFEKLCLIVRTLQRILNDLDRDLPDDFSSRIEPLNEKLSKIDKTIKMRKFQYSLSNGTLGNLINEYNEKEEKQERSRKDCREKSAREEEQRRREKEGLEQIRVEERDRLLAEKVGQGQEQQRLRR